MNNQAAQVGRGVGAGAKLGNKMISSGTLRTTLNNPVVDAGMTMANGMDADLAKTVASSTNAKIKTKKAKKEEKTKAIESTAQTVLAVAAMVVTAGAAAPALGSVLTGSASASFYAVQGANIALQAAIGSRTGGVQGAVAGVVNGTLQSLAATNLGNIAKGADKLVEKADEIQSMAINNPLIAKTLAATNVSYTKEDGWGIKANVSGVVQALGVRGGLNFERFTNVTIGQSQRGGASVNLGFNTGAGTLGVNYTGATGRFDGSFDIMERQAGTGNLSAELNYGEDGFSVSGNADLGNGLGFGLESGRNGTTGSLTILGSQQGTVDEDGNYEANGNFLGEISGQDIIDLNNTRQAERDAAENERNPVKDAKDAKNAKDAGDAKEARDDDAKEVGGEEGPSGLVDLAFAGLGVVMSAGAAFLAGGGSGSASPSVPTSGQSGAGNGSNTTVARKPEDEKDGKVKGDGDNTDEPPKKQPHGDDPRNPKKITGNEDNANTIKDGDFDFVNEMLGKAGLAVLVATDIPKNERQANSQNINQSETKNLATQTSSKILDYIAKEMPEGNRTPYGISSLIKQDQKSLGLSDSEYEKLVKDSKGNSKSYSEILDGLKSLDKKWKEDKSIKPEDPKKVRPEKNDVTPKPNEVKPTGDSKTANPGNPVKESNNTPAVSNAEAAKVTARDEIARREGFEPNLYQDRNGFTAVGYGHTPGLPKLFLSVDEIKANTNLKAEEKAKLITAREELDKKKDTGKYAEEQKRIVNGLPENLRKEIYTPLPKDGRINNNLPNDTSGKTYRDLHPYFGSDSLTPESGKNVLEHDLGEKIKTMLLTIKPETLNTFTQTQIAQVYDFIYWSGGSPTTKPDSPEGIKDKADWTKKLYDALNNSNRKTGIEGINQTFDDIIKKRPEMASRVNGYIQSWVKVNGWRDAFPKSETNK